MGIMKNFYYFLFFIATLLCWSTQRVHGQITPQKEVKPQASYPEPNQCDADLRLITVPEGFVSATNFNGYIHLNTATSIVMTSVEHVNFLRLCAGMTPEFFSMNGLSLVEENEFTSDYNVSGRFYKAHFVIDKLPHVRYMIFSGDINNTLWLNITYPQMFEPLIGKEVPGIIQSIKSTVSDEK
jgi:hypothetical protein